MVSLAEDSRVENALRHQKREEEQQAQIRKLQKPHGYWLKRNGELLEKRRIEFALPNGMFTHQMAFDRIMVAQLSGKEKAGDTTIILPGVSQDREMREAPKGIIVGAGLLALDELRANGIDLGHMVTFIRNAPFRLIVDNVNGKDCPALLFRAGDVCGSEDLAEAIRTGEAKIEVREVKNDYGVVSREHFLIGKDGKEWNPRLPFVGDDF